MVAVQNLTVPRQSDTPSKLWRGVPAGMPRRDSETARGCAAAVICGEDTAYAFAEPGRGAIKFPRFAASKWEAIEAIGGGNLRHTEKVPRLPLQLAADFILA